MKKKSSYIAVFTCLMFLNLQTSAQNYQYCHCPKGLIQTLNGENSPISVIVSNFPATVVERMEIEVRMTDGTNFGNVQVFLTANGPYPNGRIIPTDPSYTSNLVTIKYLSKVFISNETEVSLYINLMQSQQLAAAAGPITIYRSANNVQAICDKYCPAQAPDKIPDDGKKGGAQKEGPVERFFTQEKVYPSAEANDLMRALNPDVDLNNPNKKLLYPVFMKVTPEQEKIYQEKFRQQQLPDVKQNDLFISNVNTLRNHVDILPKSKMMTDKGIEPAEYTWFLKSLVILAEDMQRVDTIIDHIGGITSRLLNMDIMALNDNLASVYQKRNLSYPVYTQCTALIQDLYVLIYPYFGKTSLLYKYKSPGKEKKSPGGPNDDVMISPGMNQYAIEEEDHYIDVLPNERLYYIYVYLNQSTPEETRLPQTGFTVSYKPSMFDNNKNPKYITEAGKASFAQVGLGNSKIVFYFQKEGMVYKKSEVTITDRELNRDESNPRAYKLIFFLDQLAKVKK